MARAWSGSVTARWAAPWVALLTLVSHASAQGPAAVNPDPVITWQGAPPCWSGAPGCTGLPRSAYAGEVRCEAGVPVPSYADDSVAHFNLARAETVKHETTHVAQLLGGCDSILALWHRDTLVRLDAEVQATCAGLEVYADSARRARREAEAIAALGMLYQRQMTSGDLYRAFTVHCHGGDR